MRKAKLYGIKNCDTVKKARTWLEQQGCSYEFHDFRAGALTQDLLHQWCSQLGWEQILNKRSTSWRQLPDTKKNDLDETKAVSLMLETPTLIKRPVLALNTHLSIGFDPVRYQQLFAEKGL